MTGKEALDANQGQPQTKVYRRNIAVIAGSSAVNSLGTGMISTYVSLYFVSIGGEPITLGFMTSIAAIIQCVVLMLGGYIADHYGRKRIMVITSFYAILLPLLYALVQDWRVFVVATVLSTLGAISSPALHATVADSIPSEKRTTAIASLQVISSFPMIFAPLAGGLFIRAYGLSEGFRLACIFTVAAVLASALITLLFLKETMPTNANPKKVITGDSASKERRKGLLNLSASLKFLLVSFGLVAFANGLVGQFYILYATQVIGFKALDWGVIISLQALLVTVLKIPGGYASDRFGKKKIMILSILTCAPCTIILALSQSFIQAAVAALLLVAAGTYYAPAHEALQADLTPRQLRGRVTAFWDIDAAVSAALGALAGGFLYQAVGPATPFYLFTVFELIAAALIMVAVKEPAIIQSQNVETSLERSPFQFE